MLNTSFENFLFWYTYVEPYTLLIFFLKKKTNKIDFVLLEGLVHAAASAGVYTSTSFNLSPEYNRLRTPTLAKVVNEFVYIPPSSWLTSSIVSFLRSLTSI